MSLFLSESYEFPVLCRLFGGFTLTSYFLTKKKSFMFELITDSILAIISEFWGVSVRKTVYHKEMDKIVVHESVITTNLIVPKKFTALEF